MYKKFIKRTFDLVFSIFLTILFLPLMLIVALIIKFSLKKVIIKESALREGKNKIPFQMYKFYTKIKGTKGKPSNLRYTRLSRIIDILRLNELPQLFNVIKGDMSFVGPRPFLITDKINKSEVSNKRYLVKPGITGLAQVKGARSITHKQKLEYDIIYYNNLSFFLDLKIVLLTPIIVIKELFNYLKKLLLRR